MTKLIADLASLANLQSQLDSEIDAAMKIQHVIQAVQERRDVCLLMEGPRHNCPALPKTSKLHYLIFEDLSFFTFQAGDLLPMTFCPQNSVMLDLDFSSVASTGDGPQFVTSSQGFKLKHGRYADFAQSAQSQWHPESSESDAAIYALFEAELYDYLDPKIPEDNLEHGVNRVDPAELGRIGDCVTLVAQALKYTSSDILIKVLGCEDGTPLVRVTHSDIVNAHCESVTQVLSRIIGPSACTAYRYAPKPGAAGTARMSQYTVEPLLLLEMKPAMITCSGHEALHALTILQAKLFNLGSNKDQVEDLVSSFLQSR